MNIVTVNFLLKNIDILNNQRNVNIVLEKIGKSARN